MAASAEASNRIFGFRSRLDELGSDSAFRDALFLEMDGDRCLEGIIDLAFFDPTTNEWSIVDWKTNRVARDKIDRLRVTYRPQLAAYCQAVERTTGHQVPRNLFNCYGRVCPLRTAGGRRRVGPFATIVSRNTLRGPERSATRRSELRHSSGCLETQVTEPAIGVDPMTC